VISLALELIKMKIEKKTLTELYRCYAASSTTIDGEKKVIFATEDHGAAYLYSLPELKKTKLWDGPGGTMSIVSIPGENGDFLAVQNFFPGFYSEKAKIVWAQPQPNGKWKIKTVLQLPYVHRFDILTANGVNYFIGCTLCTSKKDTDDWSDPGKIYVGELPKDLMLPMKISVIKEELLKNHGYSRTVWKGKMTGMVTCESGVFAVTPPQIRGEAWTIETILERPVSDVAVGDIDGDGQDELITIEPFHGNQFVINHKTTNGYEKVYEYPDAMEFGHVVWAGKLRGIPTIIGGQRGAAQELFYIQYKEGKYVKTTIEAHIGPSNISVINDKEQDIIISANREIGEAVLYIVTD